METRQGSRSTGELATPELILKERAAKEEKKVKEQMASSRSVVDTAKKCVTISPVPFVLAHLQKTLQDASTPSTPIPAVTKSKTGPELFDDMFESPHIRVPSKQRDGIPPIRMSSHGRGQSSLSQDTAET
eukprot:scaffold5913_cov149-Ochromonas_danica.AAC.1